MTGGPGRERSDCRLYKEDRCNGVMQYMVFLGISCVSHWRRITTRAEVLAPNKMRAHRTHCNLTCTMGREENSLIIIMSKVSGMKTERPASGTPCIASYFWESRGVGFGKIKPGNVSCNGWHQHDPRKLQCGSFHKENLRRLPFSKNSRERGKTLRTTIRLIMHYDPHITTLRCDTSTNRRACRKW